jgi:hypothetical protein
VKICYYWLPVVESRNTQVEKSESNRQFVLEYINPCGNILNLDIQDKFLLFSKESERI